MTEPDGARPEQREEGSRADADAGSAAATSGPSIAEADPGGSLEVGERLDRWATQALSVFFAAGAVLVLVSQPLEQRQRTGLALIGVGVAALTAAALASRRAQVTPGARHLALALGSLVIASVVIAAGRPLTPDGALLVWVGLYGGFFVSRRALAVHVVLAMGLYTSALLLVQGDTPLRMLASFALLVGGATVAAAVWSAGIRALVDRLIAGQADLARTDQLTGLTNRHGLQRQLRQLARRSSSVAVLAVDLDHFKPINDQHGHATGDAVLQAVAGRLRHAVPARDVVARIGGDEFVICCADLEGDDAEAMGRRLHARLTAPYDVDGLALTLAASIGIAWSRDGSPWRTMQAADGAMYEAKRSGDDLAVAAAQTSAGSDEGTVRAPSAEL